MKLSEEYTRLDDDLSFGILRTNPRLTTNTKVIYDGKDIYLESYSATPLLATKDYKNNKVYSTGLFNMDMKKFLVGSGNSAYAVGQNMSDLILGDSYDNQYETMYWTGAEAINSDVYPQELGFVAPLYIRKKRPDFFVVFKLDGMANTNLNMVGGKFVDGVFDFKEDILNKAQIIKTFDLREGTPIGNYIKNYVEQKEFVYDRSLYVNFGAKEAYYYGIDRTTGVLTQKVENIAEQLIENDSTIVRSDDWITSGFERNNLIFPYIINFEFLFDDDWTKDYGFARYFGMYCNGIDLYDLKVDSVKNNRLFYSVNDEVNNLQMKDGSFYYIKSKNDIYSVTKDQVSGRMTVKCGENLDPNEFMGFESSSISVHCEKLEGSGRAEATIEINNLKSGDKIHFLNNAPEDSDIDMEHIDGLLPTDINDWHFAMFTADDRLDEGTFTKTVFSCKGTPEVVAKTLAKCVCEYNDYKWMNAYAYGNRVVFRTLLDGTALNDILDIEVDPSAISEGRVTVINNFGGGTDSKGTIFKVYAEDKDLFFDNTNKDRDKDRYIRFGNGTINAKVMSVVPYINDNDVVEPEYMILSTDEYGKYIRISELNLVEIMDKFYPKIGVLSFFPVKDFDFDTVSSAYGDGRMMKKEIVELDSVLPNKNSDSETDDKHQATISYGRFFDGIGDELDTEYDYYSENIIPDLSVSSKTVPFVNKWGYADDGKDSCENPYRLNASKIFGACNFSANTFVQTGDIFEYTHSMPYYITNNDSIGINEYIYIKYPFTSKNMEFDELVSAWTEAFMNTSENWFEKIFINNTKNKRFSKKYSRFHNGDDIHHPSTLFRGVEFDIMEIRNNTEIKSGRYNDYKFSFIYVPIYDSNTLFFTNRVYFVKNDTFKFVVGMVFFSVLRGFSDENILKIADRFNKAYVYGGCSGIIPTHKDVDIEEMNNIPIDDVFSYNVDSAGKVISKSLKIKMPTILKILENRTKAGQKLSISQIVFKSEHNEVTCSGNYNVKSDGSLFLEAYGVSANGCKVSMKITTGNDHDFDNLYDSFNQVNINSIKNSINTGSAVVYMNTSNLEYKIKIKDPDTVDVYDIFTSVPVIMINDNKSIVGSVDISLKPNATDLNIYRINRYSGYYNPIFKDILFYNDNEMPYSNTSFDYTYKDNYGSFGIINNLWFHKVNEDKSIKIIKTLTPYYPLIGQYALDYKDYNIWAANGDMGYYTKQLDIEYRTDCKNICSMKNNICMFGSKYLNVPETIEIDGFIYGDGSEKSIESNWNEDWITDPNGCDDEMMFKEVNNCSVDFYFFLHKRLIRYFCENEEMREEFKKYINPEYSYGLNDTLDDDIKEYVEKNILRLYKLDRIKVYVKRTKMAVHNNMIENEYPMYLDFDVKTLKANGFKEINTVSMSKLNVDDFDRKLVYNLRRGEKEDFGFSFVIKKI